MESKWLWALVIVLVIGGLCETEGCLENERIALLHLKSFFNDSYGYLSDWKDAKGSNCCDWERVECSVDSKRVIQIHLGFISHQSGYLNVSLFLPFTELKTLNLGGNELYGFVDNQGFEKVASALKKLEILDLSYNDFNDSILTSLSELSSLKSLYLVDNKFTGPGHINGFPKLLSALKNLEVIDLSYNYFNDTILTSLSGLSSLKTLNLAGNQFKRSLNITGLNRMRKLRNLDLSYNAIQSFDFIQDCYDFWNLEKLYLEGNSFEGLIPSCFNNLTSLRLLDISNNHIQLLPSFTLLANNSHLKFLFVDQNNLVTDSIFQTQTKYPKFQLKLLSMSNCLTKGLIPKELSNFLYEQYDLRYIDISYNNFGGENPAWLLKNNTRLQQFFMAGNSFKGFLQLPKQANVDLIEVDMSGNKLQGQIPLNICSTFSRLEHLFLSRNAFEGNIPPCLGGMKSLSSLDLSFNNFSGEILEKLVKNNSLWILRLSNNSISGNIPPSILSSSKMRYLYLDNNNFDGEIPLIDISSVSFSYLRLIDFSNNHLSGKLPRWIWNLSRLDTLVLSNNNFDVDHIPLELCNLVSLTFLDLSQSNFSGSLPSCFSSLTRLEHLQLSKNKLSGPLPRALYNSSSLVTLDFSQNNLTGKIPNWISTLSALRILILKANQFESEIPSEICRLKPLRIIDLSQNKLFGHIPSCLSNLTLESRVFQISDSSYAYSIEVLEDVNLENSAEHFYPASHVEEQVVFTTKKGMYTYLGNVLKYMSGIDLSCNMLTGQIPPELGNLSELNSLNLSHNNLIGSIPSTFSNLTQVESLDLSYNKLSGIIPVQMMELNSLAVFNVSYNNLSDGIPYEKAQFATFDESSYLGNPFLCGPPKHESCTKTDSTPTTANASDNEEENGFMDIHVFYVTSVVSYTIVLMTIGAVLVINPHWRRTWFYFIQQCIDNCYYFIMDNVVGFSLFRRNNP